MPLSIDQLTPLTEASPLLDRVQDALSNASHKSTTYALLKLQQDAGIELEKEFGIYDPKAGPETARLDKAYKEVTPDRLRTVLEKAYDLLPPGELKSQLGQLNATLLPLAPQAAVSAPKFSR